MLDPVTFRMGKGAMGVCPCPMHSVSNADRPLRQNSIPSALSEIRYPHRTRMPFFKQALRLSLHICRYSWDKSLRRRLFFIVTSRFWYTTLHKEDTRGSNHFSNMPVTVMTTRDGADSRNSGEAYRASIRHAATASAHALHNSRLFSLPISKG